MDKPNTEIVKKKLSRWQNITGTIALLGLIGIPISFIIWIWLGFSIFMKLLLTSIIITLIGKFFNHVTSLLTKQIKDLDNSN